MYFCLFVLHVVPCFYMYLNDFFKNLTLFFLLILHVKIF